MKDLKETFIWKKESGAWGRMSIYKKPLKDFMPSSTSVLARVI